VLHYCCLACTDTARPATYALSLHDALPILGLSAEDGIGDLGLSYPNNETIALRFSGQTAPLDDIRVRQAINYAIDREGIVSSLRSEEHTSELQSRENLVCRLLLEKKKIDRI